MFFSLHCRVRRLLWGAADWSVRLEISRYGLGRARFGVARRKLRRSLRRLK